MSGQGVDVVAQVMLTPEQIAKFFWQLDSEQQADFFAALERMAGIKLCFQMAAVVNELAERAERADYDGLHGFQTMLAHAQGYPEAAASWRAARAKLSVKSIARAALANVSGGAK